MRISELPSMMYKNKYAMKNENSRQEFAIKWLSLCTQRICTRYTLIGIVQIVCSTHKSIHPSAHESIAY